MNRAIDTAVTQQLQEHEKERPKTRRGIVNAREAICSWSPDEAKESAGDSYVMNSKRRMEKRIEEVYDIRDLLGSGTSGEVRRAIHRRTGEERAVKIMSINRSNKLGKEVNTELQAEAAMLQALDHPYIVKLYDIFTSQEKSIFLVMEIVHGGDLFDRIVQKGKFSEPESRRVMRRLLSAVHYLHVEKDVVHRDLKPENILCVSRCDDVHIKLTDFGLAKFVTEDGLKTYCGTPQYFAPEVMRRRNTVAGKGRYGKQADMWSIGVILYILLSGQPPFDPEDGVEALSEFRFDYDPWPNISKEAIDLVRRLLQSDPSKRLDIAEACSHSWILTEDGDTHRYPLKDPRLEQKKSTGSFLLEDISQKDQEPNNENKRPLETSSESKLQPSRDFQMVTPNSGNDNLDKEKLASFDFANDCEKANTSCKEASITNTKRRKHGNSNVQSSHLVSLGKGKKRKLPEDKDACTGSSNTNKGKRQVLAVESNHDRVKSDPSDA